MAEKYWTGKAEAVAQVSTAQITAYDAATTYSLTVGGLSVSVVGDTDVNTTATNLAAAWEASSHPYFAPIAAVSVTDTVTLTGPAGMMFIASSSKTGGTGTIGAVSDDTDATGPNHLMAADNWNGATAPVNGDDVTIDNASARICWDLDQSGASITFASFIHRGGARIGLSTHAVATTADGETVSTDAPEYRDTYMMIPITDTALLPSQGSGTSSGSGRIKIDNTKAGSSTTRVGATASTSADSGLPAIRLKFANAGADLYVNSARAGVGVAIEDSSETTTMGDIVITDNTNISRVRIGKGVSWADYSQDGGICNLNSSDAMASITVDGGTCYTEGTQACTTMTVNDGGLVIPNATGTITTLTQNRGSSVDFNRDSRPRTVTNYNYYGGERHRGDHLTIANDNRTGRTRETIA